MTTHPFTEDLVTAVADEHGVDREKLDTALDRIQRGIERGDGQYEYSSEHSFGWSDDEAFYLYGNGIWETLGEQLSLDPDLLDPARTVHRRRTIESAERRDEERSVGKRLTEDTESLVVANTAEGEPLFGQDV